MLTLRRNPRSSSIRAVSRWCASTLALLAALPFTAPFPTCNLDMLMRGNAVHRTAPVGGRSQAPSIADAVLFLVSAGDTTENLKNLGLAAAVMPLAPSIPRSRSSLSNAPVEHTPFSVASSPVLRI